ncbi:hypothetical protein GCM10023189_54710 [Nibrella saemangeumensis]|uniref:DUF3365 domain-containing protein n=1 Tax=Nibrella saemangeumensis TaxID=1084526 RepID=A0ABP8NKZ5_9BACT
MNRCITLFTLLTLLAACNTDRIQYSDKLKQEMADKKVKRVTAVQMNEAVDEWGQQIANVAQTELTAKLKQAGTTAQPAELCQLQTLPKTQAIAKKYGVTVRLLGAADVNNQALAAKEREVLDAYLYNAENKLPQTSNIQRIGDTLFVYNAPVPAENPICQQCFTGQAQPLAVWRIAFPKKEVIRHISTKK